MSINSPGTLFKQSQGFLETKVYIAGLPRKVGNTLVKQVTKIIRVMFIHIVLLLFWFCIIYLVVAEEEWPEIHLENKNQVIKQLF